MRNFNTNQTRHFYVDGVTVDSVEVKCELGTYPSKVGEVVEGLYFSGTNADNLPYRSDTIDPKKIVCVKHTKAAEMATKLLAHTITINPEVAANAAALAGKTVGLSVTVHQLFDYDDSNCTTFTVHHKVAAKETDEKFYEALAAAIKLAMPKPDKQYPYFDVKSSASGLVLTEMAQKYVRGKLTGEPVHMTVSFSLRADSYMDDEFVAWGVDNVAASGNVVPANYVLADLEYFAYGERGDYFRGNNWPNNVEPTYAISPKSTDEYDVLSVEYYWSGEAENVQRSPRLIQVAGPAANIKKMYDAVKNAIAGTPIAAASEESDPSTKE